MPRRPPRSRRLATAARWPVGHRADLVAVHVAHDADAPDGGGRARRPTDAPPPLPPGVPDDEIQLPEHGAGPLFHRRYRARIRDSKYSPEELMALVSGEPDRVAPTEFASFQKVHGDEGRMAVGDEFVVRMPGPWDGPVRVVDVQPTSFRLVTLAGHLEAGQIEFTAQREARPARLPHRVVGAQRRSAVGPALRPRADGQGDPAAHVDVAARARRARRGRAHHRRHRHRDAARGRWRSSVSVRSRPSGRAPGSPICAARA